MKMIEKIYGSNSDACFVITPEQYEDATYRYTIFAKCGLREFLDYFMNLMKSRAVFFVSVSDTTAFTNIVAELQYNDRENVWVLGIYNFNLATLIQQPITEFSIDGETYVGVKEEL